METCYLCWSIKSARDQLPTRHTSNTYPIRYGPDEDDPHDPRQQNHGSVEEVEQGSAALRR